MQTHWPRGQRAALSLTYDDSLPIHWQHVAPELERRGLRATFYTPIRVGFLKDVGAWRAVAAAGHELGNHTIFHPCRKPVRGEKSWIDDAYDLTVYSEKRLVDELDLANAILESVDGKTTRSYGNTCHELYFGEGDQKRSMEELLVPRFAASRGSHTGQAVNLKNLRLHNLGCTTGDHKNFTQFKDELEAAIEAGAWIIYCIHGVGKGTHNGFVETEVHTNLLNWLETRQHDIWTAPLLEVALYVKGQMVRPGLP